MQRNSLPSALALAVGVLLAIPALAAQEDPAEVVAQQRTLEVVSNIDQQLRVVDAQLNLAKKKQELEALQSSSTRLKAAQAAVDTARRETGMPVVARITGGSGLLFAVVTYPDGREDEVGVGAKLRGSGCRVEAVSDSPDGGVPVRCGKKIVRLQPASGHAMASAAVPQSASVQPAVSSAQLSPPAAVPVTAGQPLFASPMSQPGATNMQVKAQ